MLIVEFAHLELSMLLRGHSHLGFSPSPLDFSHLDFPPFLQSLICLDPSLSAVGKAMPDPLPLVLDSVHFDLLSLLQGAGRFGSVLLVLDPVHCGPLLSLRGSSRLGFVLPVLDFVHLDSSPSPRGSA